MEFSQPPMGTSNVGNMNFSVPPPSVSSGGGGGGGARVSSSTATSTPTQSSSTSTSSSAIGSTSAIATHHPVRHNYFTMGGGAGKPGQPFFKPFVNFARGPGGLPMTQDDFDGKRLRKSVMRKTVDYNSAIIRALENRVWQRDYRDRRALQPESIYAPEIMPPPSYMDNPINAVTTRFVKTATNKMRCPIFTLAWTPEGRRLVTGASSGEFTLWNGLTFNFETILQAHDVPVRTMVWSHNDNWMVTGDHGGFVKYWQSNMNNVRLFQAHKEPVRGISFSPSDNKFVSCSDDGTLKVWDFLRCQEEKVLRGHGADVKCVHWHPQKALIVSGSKDNQQPIKLWCPKSGQALATLHAHKSTVMDLKWNDNGNWLITASRDHLLKLFDLRNLRDEVQVFRGHKKEASAVSWHPIHEGLFSSGGSDGSILFWNVGTDKEVGAIDTAHDSIVWTLAWHPLGHILCSGSNDHTIKFWTRNRPGDAMRDKYNLNTLPAGLQGLDECDIEDNSTIPGMGLEDKIDFTESLTADRSVIPGLDLDTSNVKDQRNDKDKKVPYSKPIPRSFQAQWNDTGRPDETDEAALKEIKEAITQIVEKSPVVQSLAIPPPPVPSSLSTAAAHQPPQPVIPMQKIAPTAIMVYGKIVPVIAGTKLEKIIAEGPVALNRFISAGGIEELKDVITDESDKINDDDEYESDNNSYDGCDRERNDDKQSHRERIRDHNAELIYDKDSKAAAQNVFIPPLMALNVHVDNANRSNNQNGDRVDRDIWATTNNINNTKQWNSSSNIVNNNSNNKSGTGNSGNMPPSLLNINIQLPNMSSGFRGNASSTGRDDPPSKSRRRDSEGRRISRFDNIDNRNRSGSGSSQQQIGLNNNNSSGNNSGNSSSGGAGNNRNRNNNHIVGRNRRR